jgi:hypothetical protein
MFEHYGQYRISWSNDCYEWQDFMSVLGAKLDNVNMEMKTSLTNAKHNSHFGVWTN